MRIRVDVVDLDACRIRITQALVDQPVTTDSSQAVSDVSGGGNGSGQRASMGMAEPPSSTGLRNSPPPADPRADEDVHWDDRESSGNQ